MKDGYTTRCERSWKNIPPQKVTDSFCYTRSLQVLVQAQNKLELLGYHFPSLLGLVGDALFSSLKSISNGRNITSLLQSYRYFHRKCLDKLHFLVPSLQTFTASTHHAPYRDLTHPDSISIPLARKKSHSDSFFRKTVTLRNVFPKEYLPDYYNRKLLEQPLFILNIPLRRCHNLVLGIWLNKSIAK